MKRGINTYNEGALHADLKAWYAPPDAQLEVEVDGYVIDIVHDDLLIEVQTGHFGKLKTKLEELIQAHSVRLVYPIAYEKWIVKLAEDGQSQISRRKSPKRGRVEHVFYELVRIPHLLSRPSFSLEVLLTQEEEYRRYDGRRGWRRRGWVTEERSLLDVLESRVFATPADLAALIPKDLKEPFSTADIAGAIGCRRNVAQKMAYCLRKLDVLTIIGKEGNALLYGRIA